MRSCSKKLSAPQSPNSAPCTPGYDLPVIALLLLALVSPAEDAALGKWKFDPAASRYESGPAPRQSERIWEAVGGKVRFLHTGISAGGTSFRTEFAAAFDGKDYPVEGGSLYDSVSLKMINSNVVQQVFKKNGKTTVTARRTVSADTKRLTIVATGTNAQGKTFTNVLVYNRE